MKGAIREISVESMQKRVLRAVRPLGDETIRIERGRGRVLFETIRASSPHPDFDKSAMDGFALRADDTLGATPGQPTRLEVIETIPAGARSLRRLRAGQSAKIMTGAPLPPGADSVIPIEHVRVNGCSVAIGERVRIDAHVLKRGTDMRRGEVILESGIVLGPSQIAILALLDRPRVRVYGRPRIGILTTGDELGEVGKKRPPGHVPDSNRYGLMGQVESLGGIAVDGGRCGDDTRHLKRAILPLSRQSDFVITSGGVSAGDFDVVKILFCAIGGVHLYRLPMKPGKPQAFGQVNGVPYFGLPGNPVSAMVVFDFIVRPALLKMSGRRHIDPLGWPATAETNFPRKSRQWEFPRVKAELRNGEWGVTPVGSQRSSDLKSMTDATGYAALSPKDGSPEAGDRVWYVPFVT